MLWRHIATNHECPGSLCWVSDLEVGSFVIGGALRSWQTELVTHTVTRPLLGFPIAEAHGLKGVQAFHREANACVRVGREFSESFAVDVGVRQGCVMSPWLFNIFMDGCMRNMKVGKLESLV